MLDHKEQASRVDGDHRSKAHSSDGLFCLKDCFASFDSGVPVNGIFFLFADSGIVPLNKTLARLFEFYAGD